MLDPEPEVAVVPELPSGPVVMLVLVQFAIAMAPNNTTEK
jgi:hypothetical protein